ncbi:EamA domain-containing protein [Plasmodiophora brassicae]|uniref:Uncharacterized protein n=1 Tax=Plasmodiophora brassicae TaxID=37360 RepID=A0A0G4IZW1_PLABS|nr:hypothetical protein PBRA_008177 [Plasmodiophora brassicae]SPR01172.1 unnamed protein product [Plasmodiophora brassicae]
MWQSTQPCALVVMVDWFGDAHGAPPRPLRTAPQFLASRTADDDDDDDGGHMAGSDALWIVVVGMFWGCTNPFLNQKAAGDGGAAPTKRPAWLPALFGIFLNWKFVVPYVINQLGSVVYVYTLKSSDLSMSMPMCNALALVFTTVTSRLIGERPLPLGGLIGTALTAVGISICFYAKLNDK